MDQVPFAQQVPMSMSAAAEAFIPSMWPMAPMAPMHHMPVHGMPAVLQSGGATNPPDETVYQ